MGERTVGLVCLFMLTNLIRDVNLIFIGFQTEKEKPHKVMELIYLSLIVIYLIYLLTITAAHTLASTFS